MRLLSGKRRLRDTAMFIKIQAAVATTYAGIGKLATSLYLDFLDTLGASYYRYRPLNRKSHETRLLTLEPGSGDEMLRCTLKHAYLDVEPRPHYETISYVCGDPKNKSTILLHGHKVQVMATSEAALRRMRLKDKPRVLWIDSICIDQNNIRERGHQVGMMHEIYTKTTHNLIWMGPYDTTRMEAFDSLKAILQEIADETQGFTEFKELLFDAEHGRLQLSQKPFSMNVYTAGFDFLRLLDNPWFSRLWVVQEAALAPSSVCHFGEIEVSLIDILRSARWLRYKWNHLPNRSNAKLQIVLRAEAMTHAADRESGLFHIRKGADMANCLRQFGGHRTSDRIDHVFGILGLWQLFTKTKILPDILQPDYKLSECEIFKRATRFANEESHNLAMLESICAPPREAGGVEWPSWVPMLDLDIYQNGVAKPLCRVSRAAKLTSAIVTHDVRRPNDLIVSGILFDSVVLVNPAFTSPMSASDMQIAFATLERPCDDRYEDPVKGLEEKISLVLVDGAPRNVRFTGQEALSGYRDLKKCLQDHRKFPPKGDTLARRYWNGVRNSAWNRAVFHTKQGHIGLGPQCCQPRDIVAILYGCRFPMVMRPLPEQDTFEILGISYVYGIMDGEGTQRHEDIGGEDTVFRIV